MEFLVLHTATVPGVGQTGQARVYRGEHDTPRDGAEAAVAALGLRVNDKMFVVSGPAYLPYTVTPEVREG
jgi:hypothetical protein